MYKVAELGKEVKEVSPFDMHAHVFMLKCQNKEFKIEYPSGYVGIFIPPNLCSCGGNHNSIEVSNNKCNECEKQLENETKN